MSLSAQQYFVLDQMGIPVWITRQQSAPNSVEQTADARDYRQIDYDKPWLVITDNPLSKVESRLLRAIFSSIDVPLSDIEVIENSYLNVLGGFSADKTVALILGEDMSQKLNLKPYNSFTCQIRENDVLTLVGLSLQVLLEQPQRKVEMWQTILQLRNLRAQLSD